MKISTILDHVKLGIIALPEFQRGYVWNRNQVRGLIRSLYFGHPVGSLLVWVTPTEMTDTRGTQDPSRNFVELLLDGQQRVTSLYGLVRGEPPPFYEGPARAFTNLRFNLRDEEFSFYQSLKMKDNPLWVDVTKVLQKGASDIAQPFFDNPMYKSQFKDFLDRLNRIEKIKDTELHIEKVTGEDKSIDVVTEIFNSVNSGGTKLSKGDLALAKVCVKWPDARREINKALEQWSDFGYRFKPELLLRSVTTTLTGKAKFNALDKVENLAFQNGLKTTVQHINRLLNLIRDRLGLDDDRVLGGRYALPLMSRYLLQRGGTISDAKERDQLLYWYVHSFLWGRYTGSTETVLNQDLDAIEDIEGGLNRLIENLRRDRRALSLCPDDFSGWSQGARFYPLLYMLTRVSGALDWETGIELKKHLLGKSSSIELHHIFPKARLRNKGYKQPEVNALANFTFLTKETNLKVSAKDPATYLSEYKEKNPDLLSSHWIPSDPKLWQIDQYDEFLVARRELLAKAANDFLDTLYPDQVPEKKADIRVDEQKPTPTLVPGSISGEEEEDQLIEVNQWVQEQGLPEGETLFELADPNTGKVDGVLDLAWPDGLQGGLSVPVALLLNEPKETERAANRAGYRYFTDIDSFKNYVNHEVLVIEA